VAGCLVLCRFSAAGMMVYPHAETAGGRKAPRHEIARVEAGAAPPRYGDFIASSEFGVATSVGSTMYFGRWVAGEVRRKGSCHCTGYLGGLRIDRCGAWSMGCSRLLGSPGSLPRSAWSGQGFLVLHFACNPLICHGDELKSFTAKLLILKARKRTLTPLV
jgi:hypothetical protein